MLLPGAPEMLLLNVSEAPSVTYCARLFTLRLKSLVPKTAWLFCFTVADEAWCASTQMRPGPVAVLLTCVEFGPPLVRVSVYCATGVPCCASTAQASSAERSEGNGWQASGTAENEVA